MARKDKQKQVVAAELEGVDLGDERREERALLIGQRLAHAVGKSLPGAMRDEAELEGAYRHLSNARVRLEDILAPHVVRTRARVQALGCAYAVHDTTDFVFGGAKKRQGLGPVYSEQDQGFLAHVSLAVSADGQRLPLGLLALGTRVRERVGAPTGEEVGKWRRGMETCSADLTPEALIHVADRESDVYELLAWLLEHRVRFILRAAQDRVVFAADGERTHLFAAVAQAAALHEVQVELGVRSRTGRPPKDKKSHPARAARTALLSYSAQALSLRRPDGADKALPATLTLNVVRAWEPSPPQGEEAVEWLLFTSEPIASPQDVVRVVEGYRTRWLIEEFFKALKTGLSYEASQLESAHALFNLLGYCTLVAYSLLLLRALARPASPGATPLPPAHLFTPAQLACLRHFSRRVKLHAASSLLDYLLAVAGLGGHLKRNGPPGWQTLSAGWQQLLAYEEGFLAAKALEK